MSSYCFCRSLGSIQQFSVGAADLLDLARKHPATAEQLFVNCSVPLTFQSFQKPYHITSTSVTWDQMDECWKMTVFSHVRSVCKDVARWRLALLCCKSITVNDFRGISISPAISKVFEHCILHRYRDFFKTSDNQFGFKQGSSCAHAIYSLNCVVD